MLNWSIFSRQRQVGSPTIGSYFKHILPVFTWTSEVDLYTLLLVDNRDDSRDNLKQLLAHDHQVCAFNCWRLARDFLHSNRVDVVVLCDWRQTGGRGAYRYLRAPAKGAPFVMVCDGGVTKWDERFCVVINYPVSRVNLAKAIRVAVAKTREILKVGDLKLDMASPVLSFGDAELQITPIEARLLKALLLADEDFISSRQLYRAVWGVTSVNDRRTLYTHVAWLREKLKRTFGDAVAIVNARSQGYRIQTKEINALGAQADG